MPKYDNDEGIVSDSGNWNVADSYAKEKIMKPLIKCDFYEDIARFGSESILEEFMGYNLPPNDVVRIKALNRLFSELIRLINNSKFALNAAGTKEEILVYKKQIESLKKITPQLIKVQYNQNENKRTVKISDEALFISTLDILGEIKSKINEPLNKNHLIFTAKEEFDPREFKNRLKERMINQG